MSKTDLDEPVQNHFAHLLFIAERKLLLGHEDTVTTVELDVRPPGKSKRNLRRGAREGVSCLCLLQPYLSLTLGKR